MDGIVQYFASKNSRSWCYSNSNFNLFWSDPSTKNIYLDYYVCHISFYWLKCTWLKSFPLVCFLNICI